MRRPVFTAGIIIAVICAVYLAIAPPPYLNQPEGEPLSEGSVVVVTGRVIQKEIFYQTVVITISHTEFPDSSVQTFHKKNKKITSRLLERVICYMNVGEEPSVGTIVTLKGECSFFEAPRNPGEFDEVTYNRSRKVAFSLKKCTLMTEKRTAFIWLEGLYHLRLRAADMLDQSLDEGNASVMKAILLGLKRDMDSEIKTMYQKSGISHILAISGLHITMVGMGLYELLRKMKQTHLMAAMFSGIAVVLYSLMVGLTSSSVRAVIMFGMAMIAKSMLRTYDLITALAIAEILTLLDNPYCLCDTGFQLSYLAVLSIGLLLPIMNQSDSEEYGRLRQSNGMKKKLLTWKRSVITSMKSSMLIMVGTMPAVLNSFYTLPLGSVLMNLLILPCMSLLMIFGGLVILFGFLIPKASFLPALCVHLILTGFEELSSVGALFSTILGEYDKKRLAVYLFFMAMLLLIGSIVNRTGTKTKKKEKRRSRLLWLCILFAVMALIWPGEHKFRICFLDVGQGDCIVIHHRQGGAMVIDGGSLYEKGKWKYTLYPYLKSQGVRKIDCWMITHPDIDHYSALQEFLEEAASSKSKKHEISNLLSAKTGFQELRLEKIALSVASKSFEADRELVRLAKENQIEVIRVEQGDIFSFSEGQLTCLYPKQGRKITLSNDSSVVWKLDYFDFDGLLMGDATENGIKATQDYVNRNKVNSIELLKVAHHGSAASNPASFLKEVNPVHSVISCGKDNPYGHPHRETITALHEINSNVLVTSEKGAVTFTIEKDRKGECFYTVEMFIP